MTKVNRAYCIGQSAPFKLRLRSTHDKSVQQLATILSGGVILDCDLCHCKGTNGPPAPVTFTLFTSQALVYVEATEMNCWSSRTDLFKSVRYIARAWHFVVPRMIKAFAIGETQANAVKYVPRNAYSIEDFGQLVGYELSCVDIFNPITRKRTTLELE